MWRARCLLDVLSFGYDKVYSSGLRCYVFDMKHYLSGMTHYRPGMKHYLPDIKCYLSGMKFYMSAMRSNLSCMKCYLSWLNYSDWREVLPVCYEVLPFSHEMLPFCYMVIRYRFCTVRPLSHMCLTSLQKCNQARWQMLFHPIVLRLEFCNPLTFGQMCISCAFYALPGWNLTKKNLLLFDDWSIPPTPLNHTSSWLVSGISESHPPPPFPLWIT
jgi:hypothetical protein